MTPVQRLADFVRTRYQTNQAFENLVANLLDQEKRRMTDAVMYALDEDGHTGEWKIKFAKDYYDKISKETQEEKATDPGV
jgi:hypothetical protein